jgi:hypothetical protein
VGDTQIAGMAAIPTPKHFRSVLDQQNAATSLASRYRCAQSGITSTDH